MVENEQNVSRFCNKKQNYKNLSSRSVPYMHNRKKNIANFMNVYIKEAM